MASATAAPLRRRDTAALQASRKAGLGRVVLSGQRQLVLVRPAGRLLVLDLLHYPTQVRAAPAWEGELRSSTATADELKLAQQLIDAACGPLDWTRYRDTTAEELAALVEAKVANQPPAEPAARPACLLQLLDA